MLVNFCALFSSSEKHMGFRTPAAGRALGRVKRDAAAHGLAEGLAWGRCTAVPLTCLSDVLAGQEFT